MSVAAASTFDLKKYFSERLPKVEQALEDSLAGALVHKFAFAS